MSAILRRKENKSLPAPEPLKLFDFLQKAKTKRQEAIATPGKLRLPKDVSQQQKYFLVLLVLNCKTAKKGVMEF